MEFKYVSEFIEKKSKFISILVELNSIDEYKEVLEEIKKTYKDATHYCYSAKFGGFAKNSDDGEPKGTAARPIYLVMDRRHLDKKMIVVVRYFGGTKLGASPLLRAYVRAASDVVKVYENLTQK